MSGLFTPFPESPCEVNGKVSATLSDPVGSWSDAAISTADEDQFERSGYASKVARLIQDTAAPSESTIYGLTGEWGSGKTSLVNFIRQDLKKLSDNWEIVDYNPWVASDPESLIEEFYRSIVESLPKNVIGEQLKAILKKTFRSIGPIAGTLGSLGFVDHLVVSKIVDSVGGLKEIKEIWKPEQDSWPTLYAKASEEFKKLDKQILLIVDDVDRLHTDELALLMKVVRLLGRFPRVNYLLIYDEESLLATLVESTAVGGNKDDALRFMEKIVQYPIDVPQLTSDQIEKQLREIFESLPSEAKKTDEREDLLVVQREMFDVWERILTTPRALRRYAALLVNWLNIYDSDEVNTGDLMILATIRIAFPSVYAQIPLYKESLLKNSPPSVGIGSARGKDNKFDCKETLGKGLDALPGELLETMLSLLFPKLVSSTTRLFPKLESSTIISNRGSRSRAISTEVYFDTYVLFQAPKHVISDQVLDNILKGSDADGSIRLVDLVNADGVEQTSSIVAKLPGAINRLENDDQRFKAAKTLIAAAENIEDKKQQVRMVNLYSEFYFQASMALSKLDNPEDINIFDRFFRKSPLNFAVYYLNKIKIHSQQDDDSSWQTQSYEEIYKKCAERIREVLDGKEATDRDLGYYSLDLLTQWQEFNVFRAMLLEDLNAKKIDIFDIGVLFLTTGYLIGQDRQQEEISSFQIELFSKYVGVEKLELAQEGLEQEKTSFVPMDLSWRGKREAVKYALKSGRTEFLPERLGRL